MKLLILTPLLMLPLQAWASDWKIRWEAAKGDTECVIPYQPRSLDDIIGELPSGHFEANADIKEGFKPTRSTIQTIGRFHGRKVLAVEDEIEKNYYNRYFMILAEVEAGKYMPIYVHQFARGAHGHGEPTFKAREKNFSVVVSSDTIGTGPSSQRFQITSDLKSPPKTELIKEN